MKNAYVANDIYCWHTSCYMAYKIILNIFNQHEKIAPSTFILNYDFLRKK